MTAFADALARRRERGDSHVKLAAALAERLPGWRHDPTGPQRSMIHGPDGARLLIDVLTNSRVHRAAIIPKMPEDAPYLEHRHSKRITAALDRGPDAIARDITTRLFPAYLADLADANALREAQADDRALQRQHADEILALDPDCRNWFPWNQSPEAVRLALPKRGERRGDVDLYLGGGCSLELKDSPTRCCAS